MSAVKYRDMTGEQRLAWGRAESAARKDDLAVIKSAEALATAQANAEQRRKLIGATRTQATGMVIEANRAARYEAVTP